MRLLSFRTTFLVVMAVAAVVGSSAQANARTESARPRQSTQVPTTDTVFVLSQPIALASLDAIVASAGATVVEIHASAPLRGAYRNIDRVGSADALKRYRSILASRGISAPDIFALRLEGIVDNSQLAAVASLIAVRVVVPADNGLVLTPPAAVGSADRSVVVLAKKLRSSAAPHHSRMGLAAPASGNIAKKPWAPNNGLVNATSLVSGPPREIHHELAWLQQTDIDAFGDRIYEHDFKLYNFDNPDVPANPWCAGYQFQFWAMRYVGGSVDYWDTSFPAEASPYFDTNMFDSCQQMDFTVGLFHPARIAPTVNYTITVRTSAGNTASSPFQLDAQLVSRNCDFDLLSAWCGISTLDDQLLVGNTRGIAPGCRTWTAGADSVAC